MMVTAINLEQSKVQWEVTCMSSRKTLPIEELHFKIGQNVKKYREEKGFTQLDLSHEIGHSTTTIISLAEIGKRKHFNIQQLYQISIALDVNICQFFELDL
jgi:DNA-binding XRE family transcriptional regulator